MTDYQYVEEPVREYSETINGVTCTTIIGDSGKFIVCIREEEKETFYVWR